MSEREAFIVIVGTGTLLLAAVALLLWRFV